MRLVIEHLEPKLSQWLYIEYSHSARIAGDLLITNVRRASERRRLSRVASVERKSVGEIFSQRGILLLDPLARKVLSPDDLQGKSVILIGGILGNDPPLGRTRELLARKLPRATRRHIGRHQFAIDGAVYVARQVVAGRRVEEIPVQVGLEIPIEPGYSVILPYAFPMVGGKPLISDDLIDYLRSH
ncbi:MAG: hypothetical protein ACP5PX_01615 [Candidatus Hadarchaeum sp.]|uniref:hypothetical protein n=1 Tax=Candidatus Hadarchaeum sp. TaxID=2883567 RepID=UPI003D13A947